MLLILHVVIADIRLDIILLFCYSEDTHITIVHHLGDFHLFNHHFTLGAIKYDKFYGDDILGESSNRINTNFGFCMNFNRHVDMF